MTPTPDGKGYWMVASDGGIFSFGDAAFYGSTGPSHLNKPIVGMTPTPDGKGYWLVASDGGIFSYGDAGFYGSTGAITLNKPIVGMTPTPDGKGYWMVATDGGIFNFGDAGFYGSPAGGPGPTRPRRWSRVTRGRATGWGTERNGLPVRRRPGTPPTEGLMFSPATPGRQGRVLRPRPTREALHLGRQRAGRL